jgi:hypothetical protein
MQQVIISVSDNIRCYQCSCDQLDHHMNKCLSQLQQGHDIQHP